MSKDLRSLFANAKRPGASTSASQRRADSRKVLEASWSPAWTVLRDRLPGVFRDALGPVIKDGDEDRARTAKKLAARERHVLEHYEGALRNELKLALDDFVSQRSGDKPEAKPLDALSLVDYGAMELATLVEAAAARALNSVDDEYTSVKLRIANLVRDPEIRESESPYRPALFFRALHQSIEQLKVLSDDELVQMLPLFDEPFIKVLVDVYRELDKFLKNQGYSAEVARPTAWRNTTRGRTTQAGGTTRGTGGDGHGAISGANAEQILQALYQRMNVGAPMISSGSYGAAGLPRIDTSFMPAMPPVATLLFGGGAAAAGVAGSGSVGAEGASAAAGVGGAGGHALVSVDLLNAINEIQKLGAMALAAVQQGQPAPDASIDNNQLRSKLVEKANDQVDKLTIEIVGLLFERINQDKHVPQTIKELLQRLQFPMIKVALTDPELFVSPDQAARTLIDRIASTSIGWTSEGEENQRYLTEVQKAVHTVLSSTEEGLAPFERAVEGFELYLLEERTRDDDPVTRAKRALADAENREVMAINATIQVRTLFDGLQIESYLREFLLETWVRVMVASALQNKDDPKAMQKYMVIVPDLVWSVQPKLNPEERKRLVNTIPPVLSVLREGLGLIDWPNERTQEFFGRLMNSHAEAVKALELAHGHGVPAQPPADKMIRSRMDGFQFKLQGPEQAPAEPVHVNDDIVKHVIAANRAEVNHLPMPADDPREADMPTGIDMVTDEEVDEVIAGFKRGDWFSLRLGDVTERVRLRWVSPRQTLYLFTPADGRQAHSVSPDALREYLKRGQMAPVEAAPLFERAVQSVVHDLQQVPAAVA